LKIKLNQKQHFSFIKYLKKKYNYNIFFIIGSDNLISLHRWKKYKDLIKMTKFIVFSRKGFDTKAKKSVIMKYLNSKNIKFLKKYKIDVSSTVLRKNLIDASK